MLSLADASVYFDRTGVYDAVTSRFLFFCQTDLYDGSRRDSSTAYRRIMSVPPGTPMPASGVVQIFDRVWLVGVREVDGIAEDFRDNYVLHPTNTQLNISRLAGFLTGVVASTSWGGVEWIKDQKQDTESSRPLPTFSLYLPAPTNVSEFDIVWLTGKAYLVSTTHLLPSGVLDAEGYALTYGLATATLNSVNYSPSQGKNLAPTVSSVPCLRVKWIHLFNYESEGDPHYKPGDDSFVFPVGTAIKASDTFVVSGLTWRVESVGTMSGVLVIHGCRR